MTSDEPPTEQLPTTAANDPGPPPAAAPATDEQPKQRRFASLRNQAKAAPVLAAILAVLVIGGLGFGAGYLVGGHEHHDGGRGRHMMDGGYARPFGGPGRMQDRQWSPRGERQQDQQDQPAPTSSTSSSTPAPSTTAHA